MVISPFSSAHRFVSEPRRGQPAALRFLPSVPQLCHWPVEVSLQFLFPPSVLNFAIVEVSLELLNVGGVATSST
jgi:hypothetical protein